MKLFTIGYGGRTPDDLVQRLTAAGVRTIAEVRLRPDRASMGGFVKTKTCDKGIERLFVSAGIAYRSLPELGTVFLEFEDWRVRYTALLQCAGHLLVMPLGDACATGVTAVRRPPRCGLPSFAARSIRGCPRLCSRAPEVITRAAAARTGLRRERHSTFEL